MNPRFFGGIDFSGAREPLGNVWSAIGRENGSGKLEIIGLAPHAYRADLAAHVAGGWRALADASDTATILWGADFPFGLPRACVAQLCGAEASWAQVSEWIADRPPDELRDALSDHHKTPRACDPRGALAPLDLRLYKQTAEGIRWLHGLVDEEQIRVLPQVPGGPPGTTIIEVYPAATHKDLGLRCGNKPRRPGEVRARPAALQSWVRFANPSLEATAVTLEDAWDATLACLTAWLVRDDLEQPFAEATSPREQVELEGWIYRVPGALG